MILFSLYIYILRFPNLSLLSTSISSSRINFCFLDLSNYISNVTCKIELSNLTWKNELISSNQFYLQSTPSQLMATSSLHLNKPNPWRHLLLHSFIESMTKKPLVLNIFRIEPVLNPLTTLILNHNMMIFYFCIFDSYLNDIHSILASSNIFSVYQPA